MAEGIHCYHYNFHSSVNEISYINPYSNSNDRCKGSIKLPSISELFKESELKPISDTSHIDTPTKSKSSSSELESNYLSNQSSSMKYYNDYSNPVANKIGKPYKPRLRKSDYQTHVLAQVFSANQFPDRKLRVCLANLLNLDQRNIQIWFQNKRQKLRG
ncbi:hypothetical protein K502DRAFT_323840 [Neoconidiobolus thromboides FSU 785]|nr:hypothetical protein K502DRAFT_323840 [Neoconidiobolus thromboides FSU 785]